MINSERQGKTMKDEEVIMSEMRGEGMMRNDDY